MANQHGAHASQVHSLRPADAACNVVELRQYALHPGQRDVLIELFDRELVESQEAVGMTVIGQFRDLDDPDLFVWLRGFPDMPARAAALTAFYAGPVWRRHRAAANATMIDSDNVLLLRPSHPGSGFPLGAVFRAPPGATAIPDALVTATICHLGAQAGDGFAAFFRRTVAPVLAENGAPVLASFVTEPSPNTFPALPVREGETVFVWFSGFRNRAAYDDHLAALDRSPSWRGEITDGLARRLDRPLERRRLSPAPRSLIRG